MLPTIITLGRIDVAKRLTLCNAPECAMHDVKGASNDILHYVGVYCVFYTVVSSHVSLDILRRTSEAGLILSHLSRLSLQPSPGIAMRISTCDERPS